MRCALALFFCTVSERNNLEKRGSNGCSDRQRPRHMHMHLHLQLATVTLACHSRQSHTEPVGRQTRDHDPIPTRLVGSASHPSRTIISTPSALLPPSPPTPTQSPLHSTPACIRKHLGSIAIEPALQIRPHFACRHIVTWLDTSHHCLHFYAALLPPCPALAVLPGYSSQDARARSLLLLPSPPPSLHCLRAFFRFSFSSLQYDDCCA